MKAHRTIGVATVCLYLLLPGAALAQETGPQERFNQAVELVTGGEYGKAVRICLNVLEQLPDSEQPRVHKLLGYAYKKLDMLPESWHHLTSYLQSSGKEDTTAGGWLQEVETALKQTHVKVSFACSPEGLILDVPASNPGTANQPLITRTAGWFWTDILATSFASGASMVADGVLGLCTGAAVDALVGDSGVEPPRQAVAYTANPAAPCLAGVPMDHKGAWVPFQPEDGGDPTDRLFLYNVLDWLKE